MMAEACSATVLIACWPWWLRNRRDNGINYVRGNFFSLSLVLNF